MKARGKTVPAGDLEEVKQEFAQWRKGRRHRTPIPQALWAAAVNLSKQYSVNHISKALHLNYTDLKKRFQQARTNKLQSTPEPDAGGMAVPARQGTAFVELQAEQTLWAGGCVMEVVNPDGGRMRIEAQGGSSYVLVELGKAFMGKGQ